MQLSGPRDKRHIAILAFVSLSGVTHPLDRQVAFRRRASRRTSVLARAVLILAAGGCTDPIDVDQYPQGTLVVGTVRRGGNPVAGVAVRVWGFVPPCRQPGPAPAETTTADGRYRFAELSPYSPGTTFCGVGRAYFNGPNGRDSLTITGFDIRVASLGSGGRLDDSTIVDVALPN